MTRSVPPVPAAPVTLGDSPDTIYIDQDVKPGSSYYYLVSAVNESGIIGMRASAPPVTAVAAERPPETPVQIRAALTGRTVEVSWNPTGPDERYHVEREVGPPTAGSRVQLADRNRCCRIRDQLDNVKTGTPIRYRVTAVKTNGMVSSPGVSNEVTIQPEPTTDTTAGTQPTDTTGGQAPTDTATAARVNVRPAVVPAPVRLKLGGSLNLGRSPSFTNLQLKKHRWLSLDDSKATVDSRGKVLGRAPGFAYIIVIGLAPDGSVASLVQRVDVKR
ncbi:MAG TPA: Ig-like domain-containing protein [Gemmatimonadales bacterium]